LFSVPLRIKKPQIENIISSGQYYFRPSKF
jgi:hypothetical protein